ncbi:MAG: hypothetical protein NVS4B8_10990 [Herpetosiphon sp.]
MSRRMCRQVVGLCMVVFSVVAISSAWAAGQFAFTFEPHGAFFSQEMKLPGVIDPQVFVADAASPAGIGPQKITHVAGLRPARPGVDAASTPISTAEGHALNLTLGAWLGAHGRGTITCNGNTATANFNFTGLIPGGLYQVTRLQFTPQGAKRTPFGQADGSDSTFTVLKDGSATIAAQAPFCPDPAEGMVIAYHSDATGHGAIMGMLGLNLHNQLAARIESPQRMPQTGAADSMDHMRTILLLIAAGLVLAAWRVRGSVHFHS